MSLRLFQGGGTQRDGITGAQFIESLSGDVAVVPSGLCGHVRRDQNEKKPVVVE